MSIGERIRYFRKKKDLTQKLLGVSVGFPENSADIRMNQYESGSRRPKADLIEKLAHVLQVSPKALDVPDIDSQLGLMHTLFALEDTYGLSISEADGDICFFIDESKGDNAKELRALLSSWKNAADKLENGEITQEQYDQWRYCYPEIAKLSELCVEDCELSPNA